jgi:cytochrome b
VRTDPILTQSLDAHRPHGVARVWDPFVRLFHWGLVASFAVAWLVPGRSESIHFWAGYAAGGLIAMRLVWGIVGTRYARFAHFVRSPRAVIGYLAAIASGREARHVGHNPAGGAMIVALILGILTTSVSGWMMTTDAYFGDDTVQLVHSGAAHAVLALVLLHVGGVVLASVRHRENLVLAMISGRKRAAGSEDVA